ncbi:ABC transporter substrate-binding protein [Aeromonas hydrophila]|uniref:substrate-binding periplasmic protein n=1 Tax=Aeromonas hydrophila TaxID=644 RepID=UPI0030D6F657
MSHVRWLLLWCWLGSAMGASIQAVTEELPPYNYRDGNGQVTGLSVDMLHRMLEVSGVTLDSKGIQLLPWARAYQMAQYDPNTVIFSMIRLPEREALFHWVGPIGPRVTWMYRLAARDDVVGRQLTDLVPWRIAVVRDSALAIELAEKGLNLVLVHDEDDKFRMLLRGRADVAPAMQMGAAYHIETLGHRYSEFVPMFQFQETMLFYFAFSRNTDEATIKLLQQAFNQMRNDGSYEEITQKWVRRFWIKPASE